MTRAAVRMAVATAAIACAMLGASAADARAPVQRLTQYVHTVLRTQDGTALGENVATQTTDGYLWIANDAGLMRFDGARYVSVEAFAKSPLADQHILGMWAAHDGALWIGGIRFVARLKDGALTRYDTAGRVGSFAEDDRGSIWFAQTRVNGNGGPLCSVTAGALRCFGPPDLPMVNAGTVRWNATDGLWVTNATTICQWSVGAAARCHRNEALRPFENLLGIAAVLRTRGGSLWVGIDRTGPGFGLARFDGTAWASYTAPGFDGSRITVDSLLEDREGSLWVATLDHGLFHINDGRVDHYGAAEGLSSDTVDGGLFEDREGTIWVSTSAGVDAFRRPPVSIFSTREGLPTDTASAVLPARDGTVWVSSQELAALRDDRPIPIPAAIPSHGSGPTSLLEDHAGRLWIGLNDGLIVFDHGTSTPIRNFGNEHPIGAVTSIVEDAAHDIWLVTTGERRGLLRVRNGIAERPDALASIDARTVLAPAPNGGLWLGSQNGNLAFVDGDAVTTFKPDAISSGKINDVIVDDDGTVIASTDRGLLVQQGTSRQLLDARHGLPCAAIDATVRDARAGLWLLARCGLIHIADEAFRQWRAAADTRIAYRLLGPSDGVRPGAASFSPVARLAPDGRLWFVNDSALQVVVPAALDRAVPALPVRVEEIVADGSTIVADGAIRLAPRTRDIEIHYTALSFVAPQRIRFRYRLDGRDTGWRDAGTRRQAFYTDLPPGAYRFRVEASAGDGIWNEDGATIDFRIPPAWYQTFWFITFCVVAAFAVLYAFYRIRLRQVAATVRDRLAVKNAERERIARDLHDTLLQSTQGLILRFQQALRRIPPGEPSRELMERALDRADETLEESRDRVKELRGDGCVALDLGDALQRTVDELADLEGRCTPTLATVGMPRMLVPMVAEEVLMVAREALVNAANHAQASRIDVEVAFAASHLAVTVRDDGVGIPDPVLRAGRAGHWGLLGMRERAARIGARLDVRRNGDHGTIVALSVPATLAYAQSKGDERSWWKTALRSNVE